MKLTPIFDSAEPTAPTKTIKITDAGMQDLIRKSDHLLQLMEQEDAQEELRDLAMSNLYDLRDTLQQYPDNKDMILSLANADKGLETALGVPSCSALTTPDLLNRINILLEDTEAQIEQQDAAAIEHPEESDPTEIEGDEVAEGEPYTEVEVPVVVTPIVEPVASTESVNPAGRNMKWMGVAFIVGMFFTGIGFLWSGVLVIWVSLLTRLLGTLRKQQPTVKARFTKDDDEIFKSHTTFFGVLAKSDMDKYFKALTQIGDELKVGTIGYLDGKTNPPLNDIAKKFYDLGAKVDPTTGKYTNRSDWDRPSTTFGALGYSRKDFVEYYEPMRNALINALQLVSSLRAAKSRIKDNLNNTSADTSKSSMSYSDRKKIKQEMHAFGKMLKLYIKATRHSAWMLTSIYRRFF